MADYPTKFTLSINASEDLLWETILDILPPKLSEKASRNHSSFEVIHGFSQEFIINNSDNSAIAFVVLSEIHGSCADWSIYREIN